MKVIHFYHYLPIIIHLSLLAEEGHKITSWWKNFKALQCAMKSHAEITFCKMFGHGKFKCHPAVITGLVSERFIIQQLSDASTNWACCTGHYSKRNLNILLSDFLLRMSFFVHVLFFIKAALFYYLVFCHWKILRREFRVYVCCGSTGYFYEHIK